jgi:hypothetical protein
VVTTDADGLLLPIELLHERTTRSAMCLQVQVARRLLDKPRPPPRARGTFERLARSLIARRHALRALIVASDPHGDLPHVGDEAEAIERVIRTWCDAHEIPANIMIIGPNQSNEQEVEHAMCDVGQFHLVHFCGHGHDVPADGAFVLRKQAGGSMVVPHRKLGMWSEKAAPWLMYMSTCHGGAVTSSSLSIRYTGVLDTLTSSGIPYAVAFRSAISDLRAKEFATSFYRRLFGEPGSLSPADAMLHPPQVGAAPGSLAWALSLVISQEP